MPEEDSEAGWVGADSEAVASVVVDSEAGWVEDLDNSLSRSRVPGRNWSQLQRMIPRSHYHSSSRMSIRSCRLCSIWSRRFRFLIQQA